MFSGQVCWVSCFGVKVFGILVFGLGVFVLGVLGLGVFGLCVFRIKDCGLGFIGFRVQDFLSSWFRGFWV